MKFLRNLKINVAMAAILICFALLIGLVAALGYTANRTAEASLEVIQRINVEQSDSAVSAVRFLNGARVKLETAASYLAMERTLQAERQLEQARAELEHSQSEFDRYLGLEKDDLGIEMSLAIEGNYTEVVALVEEQYAALEIGDLEDFDALRQMLVPPSDGLAESFAEFSEYADESRFKQMSAFEAQTERFLRVGIGVIAFTVVMIALIYLGLRKLVVEPIYSAVENLQQIARADLSHSIDVPGNNEIGQLFAAMHHMQQNLGKIVNDVRDSSNSIYVGSTEISSGNNDLSSRTEQQAASLEETATSMEELTATVKQNADNARQASSLANDASVTATRGGEVVNEVVDTMQRISDSSKKIADITGMIDSIAFQTNILALNASVEAARAGEQGRGFAVVAGEVRNLAGNSADAAREIKQLIENSAAQVDQGSSLVAQAGETMKEVVGAVKRVTDIMDEISAASQEQSGGIDQVSNAVSQMDEVTQQNATLVQEAAAAAASLEEQARRLEEAVAIFKLAGVQARNGARSPHSEDGAGKREEFEGSAANDTEPRAEEKAPVKLAAAGGGEPRKMVATDEGWEEF